LIFKLHLLLSIQTMQTTHRLFALAILSGELLLLAIVNTANGQDQDPRAYVKAPIRGTLLIAGYGHSKGGVATDPTLPVDDLKATVNSVSVGVARTFSFFGYSAQALAVVPFGWVDASARVNSQTENVSRTGFFDMRMRMSVLLLGGRAVTASEFAKEKVRTLVGASITVVVPTGQYYSSKIINLGTSRWSFKPEVALSQKLWKRWTLDFYTGVWLFTRNESYYPGSSVRTQDPLLSFQTHLSYNINPRMWIAITSTFYTGGKSAVNDTYKDDRQTNVRVGSMLSVPVGKRSTLKIAYSKGAIVRIGSDFSTISVGWTSAWFALPK
jgi:hypothetical protein